MLLSFVLFSCAPRSVNDSHIQTPIVQTVKEDTPVSAPPPVEPPPPKNVELATDLWDIDPRLKPYEDLILRKDYNGILEKIKKSPLSHPQLSTFLTVYALIGSDQSEKAIPYQTEWNNLDFVPKDYQSLMSSYIYEAAQKTEQAKSELLKISQESPFYTKARLKGLQHLTAKEQFEALKAWLPTAHPSEHDLILRSILPLATTQTDRFYYLKKIFTLLPKTQLAIDTNNELKGLLAKKSYSITLEDRADRAEALMKMNLYKSLTREYAKYINYNNATEANCRIWFAYGRSLFKINSVTKSQAPLTNVTKKCKEITPNLGAPAYYIAAKGLERKKEYTQAAVYYESIPKEYPNHSMADDGYVLAGIDWQIEQKPEKAIQAWKRQIQEYPDGDMLLEGYWRLSWNLYQAGKTEEAISWAEKSKDTPLVGDITHAMALRYWSARWKVYPNAERPSEKNPNEQVRQAGVQEWLRLCQKYPTHFYALLAAQHLRELAPQRLKILTAPTWLSKKQEKWILDPSFAKRRDLHRARQFSSLGLVDYALQEIPKWTKQDPTLLALYTKLEEKIDKVVAHDRLHKSLNKHIPGEYGRNHLLILEQGYPNRYYQTVQEVSSEYSFPPRLFHSLIREESSFNPEIVSWAGAQGLSQLMPGTAKRVAKWLGFGVNRTTVFNPKKNLSIGSRYLEYLHDYFNGNSFMAIGAYNAGEGNMKKWNTQFSPTPTDHLIEQVPFRETRGYIKRVIGTYQLYSVLEKKDLTFPDWTSYNHNTQPK